MLTRSQTATKNCKVEKNTVLPLTKLQKVYNKPENVFTIVRTRSYNNVVDKLQNNKSIVSSIVTRSSVDKEVNIDFDGASHEWRRNKRSCGNGSYVYK